MRNRFRPVTINVASVDIVGWPGLAVVLVIVAIAMEFPATRALLAAGAVSGAAIAAVRILRRERHV
jgi:hypothetical protein